MIARPSSSCRSPTRRRARAARQRSSVKLDALHRVELAAVLEVEPHVQVARPAAAARAHRHPPPADERPQPERARRQVGDPQPGVERVLDRAADEVAADDDDATQRAGRHDRPPRPGEIAARSNAFSMIFPR